MAVSRKRNTVTAGDDRFLDIKTPHRSQTKSSVQILDRSRVLSKAIRRSVAT